MTTVLDASGSRDPAGVAPLTYTWSCKSATTGLPCRNLTDASRAPVILPSSATVSVPPGVLEPGMVEFSASVAGSSNRQTSTKVLLEMKPVDVLRIGIVPASQVEFIKPRLLPYMDT
jgi:hypothetical protein